MSRRIVVKGSPGAGKTTLARTIAARLGLVHIELDALHHDANWAAAPAEVLRARLESALDDSAGWVVDGNYDSQLGTVLLDRADLIVWLDLPLALKFPRLLRRTFRRYRRREILWNGNRESLRVMFWGVDGLFLLSVRRHFRHRRQYPAFLADRPVVRLRTDDEVEHWLERLRP